MGNKKRSPSAQRRVPSLYGEAIGCKPRGELLENKPSPGKEQQVRAEIKGSRLKNKERKETDLLLAEKVAEWGKKR